MPLTILHTNDFHGRLTPELAAKIRSIKHTDSALYFDSGDVVKSGNLAIPLRQESAWALLESAECDASTLGNRESHPLEAAFKAKLAGVQHPIVCANLLRRNGERIFPESIILDHGGYRVGVFGVMVPMVTKRMATQAASAYLWEQPIPTAVGIAERLRAECDVLIALTHIGFAEDQKLAESGAPVDLIFGGHSHTVLEKPLLVGKTWICQGGSHGHYVGRYQWDGITLTGGLLSLDQEAIGALEDR